jgi:hypothetical protein
MMAEQLEKAAGTLTATFSSFELKSLKRLMIL